MQRGGVDHPAACFHTEIRLREQDIWASIMKEAAANAQRLCHSGPDVIDEAVAALVLATIPYPSPWSYIDPIGLEFGRPIVCLSALPIDAFPRHDNHF